MDKNHIANMQRAGAELLAVLKMAQDTPLDTAFLRMTHKNNVAAAVAGILHAAQTAGIPMDAVEKGVIIRRRIDADILVKASLEKAAAAQKAPPVAVGPDEQPAAACEAVGKEHCWQHDRPGEECHAPKKVTTDGKPPIDPDNPGAPGPINPKTGQHTQYWVLSPEERAKGFIRPVRTAYRHVGDKPKGKLRDLTDAEKERFGGYGYVKFEPFPESESPKTGRFWTQEQLDDKACNTVTSMGRDIAETYARDPKFYGSTFCMACAGHHPVEEFVWEGTDERVGS